MKTSLFIRMRYYFGLFFIMAIIFGLFGRILISSKLSFAMFPADPLLHSISEPQ